MSKTLDRIAKVLNQAENASTPEEAATFMEKAQTLASLAAIDLAVARAHTVKREQVEQVEVDHSVQVNPFDRRAHREHFMDLFIAVVDANDLRVLIGGNQSYAFVTGFPSDIAVAEALYGTLAVAMAAECDAAIKRGDHRETQRVPKQHKVPIAYEDRAWGDWDGNDWYGYDDNHRNPPPKNRLVDTLDDNGQVIWITRDVVVVDARVFRANFYAGFVSRTRSRLIAARQEARIAAGAEERSSDTAVALRDKEAEVDAAFDERLKALNPRGSYGGAQTNSYSDRGRVAGSEAAARVRYDESRDVKSNDRLALS